MKSYLNQRERAIILRTLTKEQRKKLFLVVGRSYRSYFSNVLAKYKGTQDWTFFAYIDHGMRRADVKCECGKPLRHQYILINRKTKEKRNIGSTHLIEELNIPKNIANEVLAGIHRINFDLDELLIKYNENWKLPEYIAGRIDKIKVRKDIQELLAVDLPLLSNQLDWLYDRLAKLNDRDRKNQKVYIVESHGDRFEYPIENEEIYKVLTGEIRIQDYMKPYNKYIYSFLAKQRSYIPVYDLIDYLTTVGLPNEIMYGQHALTKQITQYLDSQDDIKGKWKDDGYMNYLLVD